MTLSKLALARQEPYDATASWKQSGQALPSPHAPRNMKAIRHLLGILVTSGGLAFLLAAIIGLLENQSELPVWRVLLVTGLPAGVLFSAAFALLRPTLAAPCRRCPTCGASEHRPVLDIRRGRNDWALCFGGWILGSLWGASRDLKVRCLKCETPYLTDTRASRIAAVLLWAFLLVILAGTMFEEPRH